MVFYLTVAEVEGMLNASEDLSHTILERVLYWGFRISEIVGDKKNKIPGIQYENIDFDSGEIKVILKGKEEITRIIDQETMNMIKLYCKAKNIKKGRILGMHRSTAHRIVKRLAAKAKLIRAEKISCHKWRHTFAIHALNRSHKLMRDGGRLNIALVSRQLGHADITTTLRFYAKYVTADLKEAAFGIA